MIFWCTDPLNSDLTIVGDCFENKRHGHSCSEKFCKASGRQMLEKVTEPSQTPNFEIFCIFRRFMKNGPGQGICG